MQRWQISIFKVSIGSTQLLCIFNVVNSKAVVLTRGCFICRCKTAANGERGQAPAIAPNENLIFDVEVVELTDKKQAMAEQMAMQQKAMQQQMQMQQMQQKMKGQQQQAPANK